jgi:hypothetical protein
MTFFKEIMTKIINKNILVTLMMITIIFFIQAVLLNYNIELYMFLIYRN